MKFVVKLIFSFVTNDVYWQVMVPYNYIEFINDLTFLVNNNFIAMSRIDDAVKRILRVKFASGLFENPLADLSLVDQIGKQVHFLRMVSVSIYAITVLFLIERSACWK